MCSQVILLDGDRAMWEPGKNRTIRVVTPPPIKPPARATGKAQTRGGGKLANTENTAASAAGSNVALPLEVLCTWGGADQADVVQVCGLGGSMQDRWGHICTMQCP